MLTPELAYWIDTQTFRIKGGAEKLFVAMQDVKRMLPSTRETRDRSRADLPPFASRGARKGHHDLISDVVP